MSDNKVGLSVTVSKPISDMIETLRIKTVEIDGKEVEIKQERSYVVEKLLFLGAKLAASNLQWDRVNFSELNTNEIRL